MNIDKKSTTKGIKVGFRRLSLLKSKYLLAMVAFCVWMFFFDRNDFFSQFERINRSAALKDMEEKKGKMIAETKKESFLLKTSAQTIEKYAREKYLMKKDNEDLFIISQTYNTK